jgi:hypothetical protein
MYSFAQRDDVRVVDEPLYGHYLTVSGAPHPDRDEVIDNMNCDGDAVISELLEFSARNPGRRLFLKHMAHHLVDLDYSFLDRTSNVILVRNPREMLPSLTVQLPDATLTDTGLKRQWELLCDLVDRGQQPIVLDSRELLLDPENVLRQLCEVLGIGFIDDMLHWPAGARPEDGIWAPHWYHNVHQSTGFKTYQAKDFFPKKLEPLLNDCQPWYDKLFALAIRANCNGE